MDPWAIAAIATCLTLGVRLNLFDKMIWQNMMKQFIEQGILLPVLKW